MACSRDCLRLAALRVATIDWLGSKMYSAESGALSLTSSCDTTLNITTQCFSCDPAHNFHMHHSYSGCRVACIQYFGSWNVFTVDIAAYYYPLERQGGVFIYARFTPHLNGASQRHRSMHANRLYIIENDHFRIIHLVAALAPEVEKEYTAATFMLDNTWRYACSYCWVSKTYHMANESERTCLSPPSCDWAVSIVFI